jgi:hypothetical protein
VVVLLLVVSVEGLHASLQLSGDRYLVGLVGGPVACGEDGDFELSAVGSELLGCVAECLELLRLFTGQAQVSEHPF